MMILLIVARWLMPKGDMTRDQLSGLLLYYLGTASDIVDFFSVLSEGDELLLNTAFVYTILIAWAWSMCQFMFVVTMTVASDDPPPAIDIEVGGKKRFLNPEERLSCWKRFKKRLISILASEAWAIGISMIMQDGPFAAIRLTCLFYWNIRTYTNYFFTFKNVLILCLQVYRLVAVYEEFKKSKAAQEEKRKEDLKEQFKHATTKARAVAAITGGMRKKRSDLQREDTIEDLSEEEDVDASKDEEITDYEDDNNEKHIKFVSETEVDSDYDTTHRTMSSSGSLPEVSC